MSFLKKYFYLPFLISLILFFCGFYPGETLAIGLTFSLLAFIILLASQCRNHIDQSCANILILILVSANMSLINFLVTNFGMREWNVYPELSGSHIGVLVFTTFCFVGMVACENDKLIKNFKKISE